jgi:hypothetical protein
LISTAGLTSFGYTLISLFEEQLIMATYNLDEEIERKLLSIAKQEQRTPEEILAEMVEQRYAPNHQPYPRVTPPDPPPRPASSLTDEDIEVADYIREEDKDKFRQAEREIRPKLYRIARRYWKEVGDTERLALTDEELDKQFWLIDHEGVPRLKSEKDQVTLLPDSLLEMAKQAYLEGRGSGRTDISEHFDEVLKETVKEKRLQRQDE